LEKYAKAYSTILASQKNPSLYHVYIDAFAGAGIHLSRTDQQLIPGSPLNALNVRPPFREYHLIDIKPKKVENLKKLIGDRSGVSIYEGDCNQILLENVFPRVRYEDYRRGLCILDPYGLDLDWNVISRAGQIKTIDLFLNFPVADMNRNVLWHDPERVSAAQAGRMTAFWGDESWRDIAYQTSGNLFEFPEKQPNDVVAEAFRQRLRRVQALKGFHIPCR
jgi:three-Cys-motif partner protein